MPHLIARPTASAWRRRSTLTLTLLLVIFSLSLVAPASAERNLLQAQSQSWLRFQVISLAGLTAANIAALTLLPPAQSAKLDAAFTFERGTELNYSSITRGLSDAALISTVSAPGITLFAEGSLAGAQALTIYGQTIEMSLLLNTLIKQLVRRARPYTHHQFGALSATERTPEAHYSFYSGHTTLSFSAAVSSSVLFASMSDVGAARATHFASTLALAGLVAHARIRSGMHYPSDVFVGALLGVGIGLAVPALQSINLAISPTEVASATGGAAVGFLLGYLLPTGRVSQTVIALPQIIPTPGGAVLSLSGPWN